MFCSDGYGGTTSVVLSSRLKVLFIAFMAIAISRQYNRRFVRELPTNLAKNYDD